MQVRTVHYAKIFQCPCTPSQKHVKSPFNINQCIYTEKNMQRYSQCSLYTKQKTVLIDKDMQVLTIHYTKIFQCPCTPVQKHIKPAFNINQCIYTEKLCIDNPVSLYTNQKQVLIHKDMQVYPYTTQRYASVPVH